MLSERSDREDREDRNRLRQLESRLTSLFNQRRDLFSELRRISGEQRATFERRPTRDTGPERLHERYLELGKKLLQLRGERERARRSVEEAVIRRRELLLTFGRNERERPDLIRKEIAELEHQQQTRALPIEEENALVQHLRERSRALQEAEAKVAVVAEHARQQKEADAGIEAARTDVARLTEEIRSVGAERDRTKVEIRTALEAAGSRIAELRAHGKARTEVLKKIDELGQEIATVEKEGRELLARTRARRTETRKTMREYAPRRGASAEDVLASAAEARLAELMRQGKVTLGG